MAPIPVIVGPTASGKSFLGLELARRLDGEIVSADSMQVYRGLDIGSAKASPAERAATPHHLIDLREPTEPFSVHEWLGAADLAIEDIVSRGRRPVVVGGTLLYIKAFLSGLFDGPPADQALRARLAALSAGELRARLEAGDPLAAARIHPADARRTIRALEVLQLTGQPISSLQQQWDAPPARSDARLILLHWPTHLLNQRINARVHQMVGEGLVEEVYGLWSQGVLGPQAREGLGYKQLADAFDAGARPADSSRMAEAIEQVKIQTRRFAKNQRTWLRRLRLTPNSLWLDAAEDAPDGWPELVAGWLARPTLP